MCERGKPVFQFLNNVLKHVLCHWESLLDQSAAFNDILVNEGR